MKTKSAVATALLGFAMFWVLTAAARTDGGKDKDKDAPATAATASHAAQDDNMRLEGERRFHSNCGRCHAAPPKFAPRMAATILRHMRVRATVTDEDMRLILRYMAQ